MTIRHLYPAVEPSLNLDFANSKKLDPRITFSRASTGTYVGADGLIKTAAANEARFDHDGDGNSLGLLIEESRTNLHIGSTLNALNQGVVGLTQGSVSTSDPTGSISTVETWTVTASTGTHAGYRFYNNTYVDFTWSIFVKSNGITRIQVSASQRDNASYIEVDLTDGSIINQTDSYATVTPLSGGWVRISSTKLADRAHGPGFWLLDNNGNRSFTGNGTDGIYVWGIQLEQQNGATFPTSYIPTTSSTVTRSADVASLTNSSIYNTDSFTILNEPFGSAAGGSTLSLVGAGETPIKRTAVYSQELTQTQINASVGHLDEFWRWRILGSSFGLPNFTTDGQVTVDWGDGTVETLTTSDHTFTNGGGYHEIGFRLDSGTYFSPYINNNATHKDKVVAVGPAPESMTLSGQQAFNGCINLKAFDATVDAGGLFNGAWKSCIGLTSFPLINISSATNFSETWYFCSSLTSFPVIDTSSGTNFTSAWRDCQSLTSFPALNFSSGTLFYRAWRDCFSLTDFPPGVFNSWTGTPANNCFAQTWDGCSSLTATSVENILNSIDTSGQSAPASGVDITIDYNASSGTPNITTAVTNLKSRGWTITLNGVAQ